MLPLRADLCPPKTRADLEWDRVLASVADRCSGPLGRELALGLSFAQTREEARAWLAQAAEAKSLLEQGSPLPPGPKDDVAESIERIRVGGILPPGELTAMGRLLGAARVLRKFLALRRQELPALWEACATDPTLDGVADEIGNSFEMDGTLADRASPRLRELRGQWQAARQRMLSRMEDLMSRHEGVLQDRFVTEREGRWVLPVRSDAHERFPGIVHATSASGATLFVEPRAVIPMGNRLKVLEADVRREEEAVYTRLTSLLSDALPSVEAAAAALGVVDVRAASARLAEEVGMTFPVVVDEPRLKLHGARHPLLALDMMGKAGSRVVPSDLTLEAGRAVVVSGPNAGGKTVALKTMGLAALMVRAGLPVACAEGSTVGLFDVVLTDVGDDQSLQKNLSTFSAHVSNLADILTETTRGALVLLDELAGGTDPREGEALAAGVLDSLCARGGAVAATTHYEGLKALALVDPRFDNASVGFDIATMTPTFVFVMGAPGSSSALAVARRFGMPATVIDRAERFLTREDHSFETVVKKLNDERAALDLAKRAADQREQEAHDARIRLEGEIEAAGHRERRMLSEAARELMDRLRRAREELRAAQARLRSKRPDADAVREAARAIERVSGEVAVGGSLETLVADVRPAPTEPVRAPDLRKGTRVWVARLRAQADVLEVMADGNVRVSAGPLKLTVPLGELRAAAPPDVRMRAAAPPDVRMRAAAPPDVRMRAAAPPDIRTRATAEATTATAEPALLKARPASENRVEEPAIPTRDSTCDLRGLRVDDALSMAETFLDRAVNANRRIVFLLHGHGTGALREAVRGDLARSPYVERFQAADPDQGGDGVTVVWLT